MVEQVEAIKREWDATAPRSSEFERSGKVRLSISKRAAEDPSAGVLDHQVKYARAEAAKMDSVPSIEEVREHFSKIQRSMLEFIITERGEY